LPAGWISRGCYVDSPSRVLTGALVSKGTLTYASCIDICTTRGFAYAGVEYGTQCLCGSSLVNPTPATSGCNMPCGGDKAAMCGGNYRINIFQNTATVKRRRAWSGEKGQPPY
jgi:glucan endo-1,3-alpha-glucosidase